jgi:phospholipase/lecithinase/hemolysin
MVFTAASVVVALAAGVVHAQAPVWGQCGGNGWTGETKCIDGAACTSYNPWYYQCIPSTTTASSTAVSSTSPPISTTTSKPPVVSSSTTTSKPPAVSSSSSTQPPASSSSVPSSTDECTAPAPSETGTADVKYFFSFGDSYSQTGFEITGQKPSAANPLGNPALPGWTASGGLDWPGYMVTQFNTSLTLSYNLAYGGATVDSDLVKPYDPSVRSFVDQVKIFSGSLAGKPSYAPWTAKNTLAGVWMGVNDVGNTFWLGGDQAGRVDEILNVYFEQIKIIYDAGVRQFVLLTVPPTDKSPLMAGGQSPEGLKQLQDQISLWNTVLKTKLADFQAANKLATFKLVDTAPAFNTAIENPDKYGAPDALCHDEDGVSCLWFNDYHPATAIQRLVGSQVAAAWDGFFKCNKSVFCPAVGGVVGGTVRRRDVQ